jgi:exopolysaccharide biosynthesis polyprenyl glycosylphosphotransferase
MQFTEDLTCRLNKRSPEKVRGGVLVDMGSQDMAAASIRVPQEKTQHAPQKSWGADASQTRDHAILDLEAVQAAQRLASRYGYRVAKRLFDIMFSLLVLVLLSWVFATVAIAIKHDSEGPVFFNQERVGKDGKTFKMYKFRSMYVDAEERLKDLQDLNEKDGPVFKIKDDPRITHVGHFIRKTSIDELPQFINVLKGDMSIVGPRPALPREVRQYTPYQKERLLVKPGITCFWQTRRNRDDISFDEWVGLDLLYIKKCSVLTDLKLIIQTIGVVLTAQGN